MKVLLHLNDTILQCMSNMNTLNWRQTENECFLGHEITCDGLLREMYYK